jgi:hypothetical protein
MASALSPTTIASSKSDGPLTAKEFSEQVKYYQQTHKAIVRFTALVNRLPANQPLKIGDHTIKRSDVSRYSSIFVSQLGDLRKMYANRKRKGTRTNNTLKNLFYVSDQLVAFYKGANLGPVDHTSPKSGKLSDQIDILISKRMATSGILTSLISRYIAANELKTPDSAGRFMPDDRMKAAFKTTKYVLRKEDLGKRKMGADVPSEKVDKIKDSIGQGSKSAFARVANRVDNKTGKPVFDPETGLLYTTMMVFNNYYRVPPQLLSQEERDALRDEDNVAAAEELQATLSRITTAARAK